MILLNHEVIANKWKGYKILDVWLVCLWNKEVWNNIKLIILIIPLHSLKIVDSLKFSLNLIRTDDQIVFTLINITIEISKYVP